MLVTNTRPRSLPFSLRFPFLFPRFSFLSDFRGGEGEGKLSANILGLNSSAHSSISQEKEEEEEEEEETKGKWKEKTGGEGNSTQNTKRVRKTKATRRVKLNFN